MPRSNAKFNHLKTLTVLMLLCLFTGRVQGQTAVEHLQQAVKPQFKAGHTLLPLSRWGWSLPLDATIELTENWGYALEFGQYLTPQAVEAVHNPESRAAKIVELTNSDPDKYPLFVITDRPLDSAPVKDKWGDAYFVHDENGKPFEDVRQFKLYSPEAPDGIYQDTARLTAEPLKALRKLVPIAVILNGGEYGLSVYGHSGPYWSKDPKVVAAKGDKSWFDYISERKAHYEMFISQAVREAVPDRRLYLWYHFGGMPNWQGDDWSIKYEPMRNVADMRGQSLYFKQFNSGWTGRNDLLTNFLNAYTQMARYDDTLTYNWVCSGWTDDKFSSHELYMGFLKSLYTAGQIGAVAGYFSYPKPGFAADLGPETPHWLMQIMILGRAQALFSHLEDFIRHGELLPGPAMHRDRPTLPAYEFPTGHTDTRVLIRKHNDKPAWLICAWAADGEDREVTVDVPHLGKVTVNARPAGSVYIATAEQKTDYEPPIVTLKLIDEDPMLPSQGLNEHPVWPIEP